MKKRMMILAATGNAHKLREFRQIFTELSGNLWEIDIIGEKKIAEHVGRPYESPEETGDTFEENSAIKAKGLEKYVREHEKLMGGITWNYDAVVVVADDSGLSVDSLGGAPGVYSARYAAKPGQKGNSDDAENLSKLLKEMENIPDDRRQGAFVCAITALLIKGKETVTVCARGEIKGMIGHSPEGSNGFGYDPVFYLPEYGKTTAQLEPEEKNAISHRGKALRECAEKIYGILAKD